jgi:membrane protease YdiL (CAAX protease family)
MMARWQKHSQDAEASKMLEAVAQRRELAQGDEVFLEGRPVRELVLLVQGELEILKREKHLRKREHLGFAARTVAAAGCPSTNSSSPQTSPGPIRPIGWRFIRASGYPLAEFGIGIRHLFGSLLDAVLFTAPVLGLVTAIKWVFLRVTPAYSGWPLIEYQDLAARWVDPQVRTWLAIYAVSCVVQELIVRGALQSSLEMFLVGRHRQTRAVVVSALLFGVNHLHLSFAFAAAAFVPGLFWGWLFARHRNLIGPTLSHIVVGCYVFFVMGVPMAQ